MPNDQIQPALTSEQWAAMTSGEDWRWQVGNSADLHEWHETIALANAALPDDDPRKIVSADLTLLRDVRDAELYTDADYDADYYTGQPFHSDETQAALSALIAKLEALLPPR